MERPKTRADCANIPRPCPFVGCLYNNYLDVRGNRVRILHDCDPLDINPQTSCALDVADNTDGLSLSEVGDILGLSGEMVRIIQDTALNKIKTFLSEQYEDDVFDLIERETVTDKNISEFVFISDLQDDFGLSDKTIDKWKSLGLSVNYYSENEVVSKKCLSEFFDINISSVIRLHNNPKHRDKLKEYGLWKRE